MIRDARQLKAKIQQLVKGDSLKSQIYLRNFFMERFLERIPASPYRTSFVLKGGLLIASLVGLDLRSTMDIDSTIRNIPLDLDSGRKIVQEIVNVQLEDDVDFIISKGSAIMEEHDYPGIRFTLQGRFAGIKQAIQGASPLALLAWRFLLTFFAINILAGIGIIKIDLKGWIEIYNFDS